MTPCIATFGTTTRRYRSLRRAARALGAPADVVREAAYAGRPVRGWRVQVEAEPRPERPAVWGAVVVQREDGTVERYFSVSEAAAACGVAQATIRAAAAGGVRVCGLFVWR
jgi:hypothetical protein